MGKRTSYEPGTFCWVELATSDAGGAKAFYGELFGWKWQDFPLDETFVYTMVGIDDEVVAGLFQHPPGPEMGPPVWASYVSVADIEATTTAAVDAGASVLRGPLDVTDAGRMTILRDPQQAVFCLWQPGRSIGATLVNAPGALTLNQLNTSDTDAAREFYEKVFGWRFEVVGEGAQPYWGIYNGDAMNGGMMGLMPGMAAPPHWLVYFATADIDTAASRIGELGGHVVLPPSPVPNGRVLVATDPQGAAFALWEGNLDP